MPSKQKESLILCCKADQNRKVSDSSGANMVKTKERFRVGLVQMRAGKEIEDNLAQAEAFIREAAECGAQYIQTPENTLIMEADSKHLLEKIATEDATGGVALFSSLAKELG